MRRHIPGLHSGQQDPETNADGLFLVRVESAAYRWHRQKPFVELHLGLCLGSETLIAANLIRKAGASDIDWLDELVF